MLRLIQLHYVPVAVIEVTVMTSCGKCCQDNFSRDNCSCGNCSRGNCSRDIRTRGKYSHNGGSNFFNLLFYQFKYLRLNMSC